jgi:hypothetical protein
VSDIPEASVAKKFSPASTARERKEARECEHLVPHVRTLATSSSPRLKRGSELEVEEVASSVDVVRDQRAITPEFRALKKTGVRACLARVWTRYFSSKPIREAHWGRFSVTKLPLNAPGSSETFAIRITGALHLPYSEVAVPIYIDFLSFSVGPAEVGLTASSATQPVPAATEQELVALLLARAKSEGVLPAQH